MSAGVEAWLSQGGHRDSLSRHLDPVRASRTLRPPKSRPPSRPQISSRAPSCQPLLPPSAEPTPQGEPSLDDSLSRLQR
jgi:hypothetical protein